MALAWVRAREGPALTGETPSSAWRREGAGSRLKVTGEDGWGRAKAGLPWASKAGQILPGSGSLTRHPGQLLVAESGLSEGCVGGGVEGRAGEVEADLSRPSSARRGASTPRLVGDPWRWGSGCCGPSLAPL